VTPDQPDTPPADQPSQGDKTVADVLATLSDDQRTAVNSVIDDIVTEAVTEALTEEPQLTHSDSSKKGTQMSRNAFDRSNEAGGTATIERPSLKHADQTAILTQAKGNSANGGSDGVSSLRDFVRSTPGKELMHADDYGVQNIEILFPDAREDGLRRHHRGRGPCAGLHQGRPEGRGGVPGLQADHGTRLHLQEAEAGPPGHHRHR
jgi:hypothetical protein